MCPNGWWVWEEVGGGGVDKDEPFCEKKQQQQGWRGKGWLIVGLFLFSP